MMPATRLPLHLSDQVIGAASAGLAELNRFEQ